jgi:hypothetical protein
LTFWDIFSGDIGKIPEYDINIAKNQIKIKLMPAIFIY